MRFAFEDTTDTVDAWYNIFYGIKDEYLLVKEKRIKFSAKMAKHWISTRKRQAESNWNLFRQAKNSDSNNEDC